MNSNVRCNSIRANVIHITDGEATDGDPTDRIRNLTTMTSSDGNVQLFNIHLSANPNASSHTFPDSADDLPDDYSKMLFETASPLTPTMRALAKEHGFKPSENARSFVLNADMVLFRAPAGCARAGVRRARSETPRPVPEDSGAPPARPRPHHQRNL